MWSFGKEFRMRSHSSCIVHPQHGTQENLLVQEFQRSKMNCYGTLGGK